MAEEKKDDVIEEATGEGENDETVEESTEQKESEEAEKTGEEGTEDAAEGSEEAAEKKSFFRKDKKEKKDKKDQLIEEMNDRIKRQLAEFENFRNRSDREKSAMFETGERAVLEKILPVVDNFERGLEGVDPDTEDPFAKGMMQVYKQFATTLEGMGVTPIEALGEEFDPNLHNAVMQEESDEYESGHVCKELQKGYKYKNAVLRHSMVAVVP